MNKQAQEVMGTLSKKKPVYIALIAIALVVILVLIYFGGKQFAGKAIALPDSTFDKGTGGAEEAIDVPKEAGQLVTLRIGANLGAQESVAYEFTTIVNDDILEFIDVDSKLLPDWGDDFLRVTHDGSELHVEHATLDYRQRISGPVRLAEVNYRVRPGRTLDASNIEEIVLDHVHVTDISEPYGEIITGSIVQPTGVAACSEPTADAALCGAFCTANQGTYCPPVTVCPVGSSTGYTPDINADLNVNGQDAFIVLKIAESRIKDECGADSGTPCAYVGNYICDDGSFRVDGYRGYVYNTADTCPYADMDAYLRG